MILIKAGLEKPKGANEGFLMNQDFTSEADNVGRRTLKRGGTYRLDPGIRAEIEAHPKTVAELLYAYPQQLSRPEYHKSSINPTVTRWFTSDGIDVWEVAAGEPCLVPSNLAVFLCACGFAEPSEAV